MLFIKKMCVLKQLKQGFSADGKPLSGLIKVEQYGKNLSVEVSVIGYAPLSTGEYYCILADEKDRAELLPLRGKAFFNLLTELDFSGGFCGVICYVGKEVVPIACGVNGNKRYEFKKILSSALPQPTPKAKAPKPAATHADFGISESPIGGVDDFDGESGEESEESKLQAKRRARTYDDESVATENYFEREQENERIEFAQDYANAVHQGGGEKELKDEGQGAGENDDDQSVRDGFNSQTDGYYLSVKSEIDALFAKYPKDDRLKEMFPYSEWVRVSENGKEYLVGVTYEEMKAKYICYALPASSPTPPAEIEGVCAFVPLSLFDESQGFFILFQDAATGECIRPESA